jgi:hypothetical protein
MPTTMTPTTAAKTKTNTTMIAMNDNLMNDETQPLTHRIEVVVRLTV